MKKETTLTEFAVPQSEETEGRLLYEIIQEPSVLPEVRRVITPEVFSRENFAKAYQALLEMYDSGEMIDFVTAMPKFAPGCYTKIISHAGDPYTESVADHATSLREIYIRRTAYFSAINLLEGVNEGCEIDKIVSLADKLKAGAMMKYQGDDMVSLTDIINNIGTELENGTMRKVPTGIRGLDFLTYRGFDGGDLVILAARPSVGKTAFLLQMARGASAKDNKCLIFSLEMTKAQLGKRVLLSTGEVTPLQMFSESVNWEAFERAVAKTAGGNIYINDVARNINEICSTITMYHQLGKCDIAFIDYLQLMTLPSDRNSNMSQLVGKLTSELKRCAVRNNIPIVVLSQLNRSSASEKRSPQLYDLRDSGSIEQDADRVLMLERPEKLEEGNFVDMWIRKNRNGKAGDICIHFKGDDNYSNFEEYNE